MYPLLSPKNLVIAVLGASVIGLGTVVAVDHVAGTTAQAQTASLSSTNTSSRLTGEFAALGQFKGEASHVFDFVTADTKLTWQQIYADLVRGETLDQIAGPNAAKLASDALAKVRAGLAIGLSRGAITPAQETRLVSDAKDAISVLLAAKLSALAPSGH
jgi:hypothetical protein